MRLPFWRTLWLGLWPCCVLGTADLAVVRPFSSDDEIQRMEEVFDLWDQLSPCDALPEVQIDLFLVYSKNFTENPPAALATENIARRFGDAKTPWRKCFRSLYAHEANLTATEDVYDARGYAVRKDWVSGPNRVFRFVLGQFLGGAFGAYHAFYFMEFDAVPVRALWLEQFVQEAMYYPPAAVRGSHYRGDSWDPFLAELPRDLLFHVNGNAIYNISHPFLQVLYDRLEQNDESEVAFDVRMAHLALENWNSSEEELPYMGDSLLVGNYARTLLNASFQSEEFIRHGSSSNVLENINESELTLGVLALRGDVDVFTSSINSHHPFRQIVILGLGDSAANETQYEVTTPRGLTSVQRVAQQNATVLALCELATHVTTRYLAFTDAHHTLASPVHILADASGSPVLPYVPKDAPYCRESAVCTSQVDEASRFFGVDLSYHQDTYETVFYTDIFRNFCDAWKAAVNELDSFDSCGHVHGPTADGYVAWIISVNAEFNYLPRNKAQMGWRSWGCLWEPHPPDLRDCAVYGQEEFQLMAGNISRCCRIIEDPSGCQAQSQCSWRPIFETGKCHPTPQVDYVWRSPRTWTTTTTSGTSTATTATVTATATTTPTLMTSTATTTPGAAELEGCWGLSVSNSAALVDSPEFRAALRNVLARAAGPGVEPAYVTQLELLAGASCGSNRRLSPERLLQETLGDLRVNYIIVIPAALGTEAAVALAESGKQGLEDVSVEETTSWLQQEIAQVEGLQQVQVQVTAKSVELTVSDTLTTLPPETGPDSAMLIALASSAVLFPLCVAVLWWRCGRRLLRVDVPESQDLKLEVDKSLYNVEPELLEEKEFRRILSEGFAPAPAPAGAQPPAAAAAASPESETAAEDAAEAQPPKKRKKKVRRLVPKGRAKAEEASPHNAEPNAGEPSAEGADTAPNKGKKKKVVRKRLVPKAARSFGLDDLEMIQVDVGQNAELLGPTLPWEGNDAHAPSLPWEDYDGIAQSMANASVNYDPHETW